MDYSHEGRLRGCTRRELSASTIVGLLSALLRDDVVIKFHSLLSDN